MDRAGQSRMRQQRVSWLSNAHAMGMQAPQILDQSRRIESYPDLQERILEHLEVTRGQVEKVERFIERYGSTPSSLKDAGAIFIGNMQALGGAFMPDQVVKRSIMSYVFSTSRSLAIGR